MTYSRLKNAQTAHELAAKLLRHSGFIANARKNNQEAQPYEVEIKATTEEINELQPMMERLCKYPVNLIQK